jgi:hypothetical protein
LKLLGTFYVIKTIPFQKYCSSIVHLIVHLNLRQKKPQKYYYRWGF